MYGGIHFVLEASSLSPASSVARSFPKSIWSEWSVAVASRRSIKF